MLAGLAVLSSTLVSLAIATTTPVPNPVIEFRAKDFAYVGPKTIKSGPTTFRLVNDGKELHHLSILKLAKGKTIEDFSASMKKPGPPPAWVTDVGGPNPAAPAGGVAEATISLDAGDYVMICFIPSPGERTPHAMKGMVAPLTVLSAPSGNAMPKADVTMRLNDYTFTMSKPLTAGTHNIQVVNDAKQSHEVVFVRLKADQRIADVHKYVEIDVMKGPPTFETVGGVAALARGRTATIPVKLTPGRYGMICFVPDAKDGKGHSHHGMMKEFTVK